MIGLDTNVLLRYVVRDDARQFERAKRLIDKARRSDATVWISVIVTAELVWALRTHYGYVREQIADTIQLLLSTAEIELQSSHLIEEALSTYRGGRADFADALIALLGRENGCEATASFDRRLVQAGLAIEP